MWHAQFNLVYDRQGGPRGGDKTFVNGMVMGMAQRPLGDGTFGLRAMLSPDPFMGKSGYPLLLASGETADGRTHLIDRQHPHELFMELAATYSRNISDTASVFLYAGPARRAGARAAGLHAPHRRNGHSRSADHAPLARLHAHHLRRGDGGGHGQQLEARGLGVPRPRAGSTPLRHRGAEARQLLGARLSWNPVRQLSMQVSWGRLRSPEALDPLVDEDRITASATYTQPFGDDNLWSTTVAWGRKILRPGETLDGYPARNRADPAEDLHAVPARRARRRNRAARRRAGHCMTVC